jgi:hypothetical protein
MPNTKPPPPPPLTDRLCSGCEHAESYINQFQSAVIKLLARWVLFPPLFLSLYRLLWFFALGSVSEIFVYERWRSERLRRYCA